jgi:hypothetical protein
MWDILLYLPSELALALRKGKADYLFTFPWAEPCGHPSFDAERPESINVLTGDLFSALLVRAKVDAFSRVAQMARANLNGQIPKNIGELQTNALKFTFKRFQQKKVQASDFLEDLRCCSLICPIPDSFWPALGQHVSSDRLDKLKKMMAILTRFHVDDEFWLESAVQYMSRCLWAQNEFHTIILAASQLAICYPSSPAKQLLVEMSQRAQGLLKAREIEIEMGAMKPWQRSSPTLKKSIRVGPRASRPKKDRDDEDGEKGGK